MLKAAFWGYRKRTVLIVSHVYPWPATHGNEYRLQRLIIWFRKQNYRVVLVVTLGLQDHDKIELTRKNVDRLEVASPEHILLQYSSRIERALHFLANVQAPVRRFSTVAHGAMQEQADVICPPYVNALVHRIAQQERLDLYFANYAFTIQAFAGLPATTTLLCDSTEVFSMQRYDKTGRLISPVLSFSSNEERSMLLRADVVIAIQSEEALYLRQLLPERTILTVGVDLDCPSPPSLPSQAFQAIGIIGSDNQANLEGLLLFLTNCWPAIRAQCPQARLYIAGKLGIAFKAQHPVSLPDGVITLGWIPDPKTFYHEMRFVVNPVVRGTGLKIKSIEALAHARPLVAYPVGLEGMPLTDELPWLEVADDLEMITACIGLLENSAHCDFMSNMASRYAAQMLSAEFVFEPLARLLDSSLKRA